jgi:hypothetical protein
MEIVYKSVVEFFKRSSLVAILLITNKSIIIRLRFRILSKLIFVAIETHFYVVQYSLKEYLVLLLLTNDFSSHPYYR